VANVNKLSHMKSASLKGKMGIGRSNIHISEDR
jgi:hypothetical protein